MVFQYNPAATNFTPSLLPSQAARENTPTGSVKKTEKPDSIEAIQEMAQSALQAHTRLQELKTLSAAFESRRSDLSRSDFHDEDVDTLTGMKSACETNLTSVRDKKQSQFTMLELVAGDIQRLEASERKLEMHSRSRAAALGNHITQHRNLEMENFGLQRNKAKFVVANRDLDSSLGDIRIEMRRLEKIVGEYDQKVQKLIENEIAKLHKEMVKSSSMMEDYKVEDQVTRPGTQQPRKRKAKAPEVVTSPADKIKLLNEHISAVTDRVLSKEENYRAIKTAQGQRNIIRRDPFVSALVGAGLGYGAIQLLRDYLHQRFYGSETFKAFQAIDPSGFVNLSEKSALEAQLSKTHEQIHTFIQVANFALLLPLLFSIMPIINDMREANAAPGKKTAELTPKQEMSDHEIYKFCMSVASMASEELANTVMGQITSEMERLVGLQTTALTKDKSETEVSKPSVDGDSIKSAITGFKEGLGKKHAEALENKNDQTALLFRNLIELMNNDNEAKIVSGAINVVESVSQKVVSGFMEVDGSQFSQDIHSSKEDFSHSNGRIEELTDEQAKVLEKQDQVKKEQEENQQSIARNDLGMRTEYQAVRELKPTETEMKLAVTTIKKQDLKTAQEKNPATKVLSEDDIATLRHADIQEHKVDIFRHQPAITTFPPFSTLSNKARVRKTESVENDKKRHGQLLLEHEKLGTEYLALVSREKKIQSQLRDLDMKIESRASENAGAREAQIKELTEKIASADTEISQLTDQEKKAVAGLRANETLGNLLTPTCIDLVTKRHLEIQHDPEKLIEHAEKNGYASYYPATGHLYMAASAAHQHQATSDATETSRVKSEAEMPVSWGIRKTDIPKIRQIIKESEEAGIAKTLSEAISEVALPSNISVYDFGKDSGKLEHLYGFVPRG